MPPKRKPKATSTRKPPHSGNSETGKSNAGATLVDDYIAGFPEPVQKILQRIRETVFTLAPEAEETIKYQIPTFVLNGNLVHYAAFANHIGFYPTPAAIQHFAEQLKEYQFAKGSIQFPLDKRMPYGLIKKIIKFRVEQNRGKAKPAKPASPASTPRKSK